MGAPDIIKRLVDRFGNNIESYKNGAYNETQTRREFIDPFFEALGWDVSNKRDYAEAYKEVIHEYSQKTKDKAEAPDYLFRIGGIKKFFVEAKRPSVNLKEDIHPAYQLRRYAWSAKLPLSVLTDFEEFSVYDCRVKPKSSDKSSVSRIIYYTFEDYLNKWEEIETVFSRNAILKGSFDRFAESTGNKKGTTEVDDAFLCEIESWREILARNIALRNDTLTNRELNFAVQKTIDRIIFLRICEDRGIEDYGQLMNLLNGTESYSRLQQIFKRADEKYNSGLFYFDQEQERSDYPDNLTPNLIIDDKAIKDIIKNLYYPESPYEFSVFSADILGHVYEQFLGKVIRLTAGHRAVVEEKPEVKKAGGVYYTPTYIVNYIVANTLGKKLEEIELKHKNKQPARSVKDCKKDAAKLKILDPACGSGSFLLGAYQYLLDWHLKLYSGLVDNDGINEAFKKDPPVYEAANGELKLTTAERKRILLDNIYGVDIDSQAVEVTKLSLLLKVLEGETEETLVTQLNMFRKRALPDLSSNIKCGNSLIGPDFYDQMEMALPDDEEKYRINVFDWNSEFGEIMSGGGFDVVIGNPPYVRQELIGAYKNYFKDNYQVYHGVADLYSYFIERAVNLLNESGYFSYIVANKWMRANYGNSLRAWLKTAGLVNIVDFGDLPVFRGATTYPCIIVVNKASRDSSINACTVKNLKFDNLSEYIKENSFPVDTSSFSAAAWTLIEQEKSELIKKLFNSGIPLEKYVNGKIYRGVLTGLNKAFVIDQETRSRLIEEDPKSDEVIKPFLLGRDIKRYETLRAKSYLILFPKGWTNKINNRKGFRLIEELYPAIANHLKPFEAQAKKRCDQGDYWWELRACDYYDAFEKPKILIPAIVKTASYTFDNNKLFSNDKSAIIAVNDKYLLGLLNSKVLDFVIHNIASTKQNGYYEYKPMYVSQLPIAEISKEQQQKISQLVEYLITLKNKLSKTNSPIDKTHVNREINATDKQIDKLVYELYGLTEDEIKIVEES